MQIETLTDEQIKKLVEFKTNVYAIKIWNAAIEAAAETANQCGDYKSASYYVEDIRKLKK